MSLVVAGLLLGLALPAPAAADVPQLPALYRGTVKVHTATGDIDAPVSTVITAWVEGRERGRIVTAVSGEYGSPLALMVGGEVDREEIALGSLVVFYVNGFKADQTALFQNDHPEVVNLTATVPPTVRGDANGDGKVNAVDITKVERMVAALDPATPGADANQDGKVNAVDITRVELIIAGLG